MDIPVDAHFVTLTVATHEIVTRQVQVGPTTQTRRERVERLREIPTQRDERGLGPVFDRVNRIWDQASIRFRLRASQTRRIRAPDDADVVDPAGFLFLASQFPARNGVSLLLVRGFRSADLGGQAIEAQCVCVIGDAAPATSLAHEFGHLLHLCHEGDIRNLMNPGLSIPDPVLTPAQIRIAQCSALATRFTGPR